MYIMKRALVSVHNKAKIMPLFQFLCMKDYKLMCSDGTYSHIQKKNTYPHRASHLQTIASATEYPHILGGRVKTLHPNIFGGLLADTANPEHMQDITTHNISKINVAIVNLYPFEQTLQKTTEKKALIEQIDVGGHSLIRAAAKNYKDTIVLVNPEQYEDFMHRYDQYIHCEIDRERLAMEAFQYVTEYDMAIANHFSPNKKQKKYMSYTRKIECKYGTNPHQQDAAMWSVNETAFNKHRAPFEVLGGRISYINVLDAMNSWNLVSELGKETGQVCAASFKHTSPAGVSVSREFLEHEKLLYHCKPEELQSDEAKAYILARNVDPKSSFGDFIAIYGHVDTVVAKRIQAEISDGVIAKSYSLGALAILRKKKQGSFVILLGNAVPDEPQFEMKQFGSCALSQTSNNVVVSSGQIFSNVKTNCELSSDIVLDLLVANISLKYAQSNSVALAKNGTLLGIGCGQQSRIDCVKLACEKAYAHMLKSHPSCVLLFGNFKLGVKRREKVNALTRFIEDTFQDEAKYKDWNAELFINPQMRISSEMKTETKDRMNGISMASDGFIPFIDNILFAKQYGVKYIVQPGGSVQDKNVIQCCNENDIAMAVTGVRQFFH